MESPVKILILEKEAADADVLVASLRDAGILFHEKVVASAAEFQPQLQLFSPDLVIAANDVPALSGRNAIKVVREQAASVPCILVSGSLEKGEADAACRQGAADFVLRDRVGRLVQSVRRIVADIAIRRAREEMISDQMHFNRLRQLVTVSTDILAEVTVAGILQRVTDAGREITGSRYGCSSYGGGNESFEVIKISVAPDAGPLHQGRIWAVENGGIYLDIFRKHSSLRLSDPELKSHPSWWGLPEWHAPLRGLLGAQLYGQDEKTHGIIMMTDKLDGGDYTEEDEAHVTQLAALASLAIKHLEAREALRQANETLERRVMERNADLVDVVTALQKEVSERRKAERALRQAEKRYRSIFTESKDVICILDSRLKVVDISPAVRAVFQVARKEVVGTDMAAVFGNPATGEAFREQLLRNGFLRDFSAEIVTAAGARKMVFVSAAAIHEEDGSISGYWQIIRDVTEQRRLEHQLLQAQKMESIGVLAGGIAHDFNNLLTAISGYAQIIESVVDPNDEPVGSSIGHILTASERAAELTRNLLAFSRKQILNPAHVPLNDIVQSTAVFLSRIIGEDIEFTTDFTDERLVVMADAGQIGQVLMNLATNARDAMPGGGRITIRTGRITIDSGAVGLFGLEVPGDYGVITFSDTGLGMDEQTKSRIFEPFFTTKDVGKGTGLGLSIIYGIIRQHNGTVTVDSDPGTGSVFRIYLPLIETRNVMPVATKPAVAVGGSETILLAEDDPTVRLYVKGVLETAGYTVFSAGNGEDALARYDEHEGSIDLLVTDVVMPKMNGRELYDTLVARQPVLKAIYISGYTADVIHKNQLLDEELNFIMKPVARNDLLIKVREVLDRAP